MVTKPKDNHVRVKTENNVEIELKSNSTTVFKLADMAVNMHSYLSNKGEPRKKQRYIG